MPNQSAELARRSPPSRHPRLEMRLDFSDELVFEREIVAKLQLRLDFAL